MDSSKPIDVKRWTRFHPKDKHPFWWGILCLIAIEATVITIFCASFFYLWISNLAHGRSKWPPSEAVELSLSLPSINLGLLLFCGWSMYYGGVVMEKNKIKSFVWLVIACCLSATILLYLRWNVLEALPFSWKENAYASFVWVITGFHFLHVLSALLGTAVIGYLAHKRYYTSQRSLGINVDTMYWYFVVIAWLPVYFILYILPRLIT